MGRSANTFTVMGNLSSQLSQGLEGKLDTTKEEAKNAQKAADALKAAGVSVKDGTFSSTAANKELVINVVGEANIKLWDTSDESGERIRVQFYSRPDKGVLTRAAQNAEIVGAM